MPTCKSCGNAFDDSFQFCPHCGSAKPPPEQPHQTTPTVNACPKCGLTDKVEKVTEIRRSQIQRLEGTMPVSRTYSDNDGHVFTYTGYRGFSGTQTTDLAEVLAPPFEPKQIKEHPASTWWLLVLMIYFGIMAIGLPIAFIATSGAGLAVLALVVMAAIWIFLIAKWNGRFKNESKSYEERLTTHTNEEKAYTRAMNNWKQLLFCYRDGCVYLPGTSTSAPVESMMEYIYNPQNQ